MSEQNNLEELQLSGHGDGGISPLVRQRRVDIDLIRIVACSCVILTHTLAYQAFAHTDSLAVAWRYSLLSVSLRMGVPLFYLVTGALLLRDKQESYGYIFRHRALRIIIVLPVLTTMLTAIGAYRGYIDGFSIGTCIRFTLNHASLVGGVSYWYLYSYLGILLMLPFYRRMVKGMTNKDFWMLFFLHMFVCSFKTIGNTFLESYGIEGLSLNSSFTNGVGLAIDQQLFYPLMGYYLDHHVDMQKVSRKKAILVFSAGAAGILISSLLKVRELKMNGMVFTEDYLTLFDYLTAICTFFLIKYVCTKHEQFASCKKLVAAVTTVGALTYGIYLLEPFVKWTIYSRFVALISSNTYRLYANLVYWILSMALTGFITWCIKKIPVIKKLF